MNLFFSFLIHIISKQTSEQQKVILQQNLTDLTPAARRLIVSRSHLFHIQDHGALNLLKWIRKGAIIFSPSDLNFFRLMIKNSSGGTNHQTDGLSLDLEIMFELLKLEKFKFWEEHNSNVPNS